MNNLTAFGAAIGGAILGMLLTLLVLAIVNGGTLNFTHTWWDDMNNQQISALEMRIKTLENVIILQD